MWLHSDETAVILHRFTHDGLLGDINKDDLETKFFLLMVTYRKMYLFNRQRAKNCFASIIQTTLFADEHMHRLVNVHNHMWCRRTQTSVQLY